MLADIVVARFAMKESISLQLSVIKICSSLISVKVRIPVQPSDMPEVELLRVEGIPAQAGLPNAMDSILPDHLQHPKTSL